MGCDIHSFAEVRGADGTWRVVGDVFPLDDFSQRYEHRTHRANPFGDRNYQVFGFLAGVRQRLIPPISQPRGLPADVSASVKASAADWDLDGHSHSWLSLEELNAVDYDALEASPEYGLGEQFYRHLAVLRTLGDPKNVRVVFWFDN